MLFDGKSTVVGPVEHNSVPCCFYLDLLIIVHLMSAVGRRRKSICPHDLPRPSVLVRETNGEETEYFILHLRKSERRRLQIKNRQVPAGDKSLEIVAWNRRRSEVVTVDSHHVHGFTRPCRKRHHNRRQSLFCTHKPKEIKGKEKPRR